jgi:hypothetical protein
MGEIYADHEQTDLAKGSMASWMLTNCRTNNGQVTLYSERWTTDLGQVCDLRGSRLGEGCGGRGGGLGEDGNHCTRFCG